ncbi:MAG: hypothetical protein JW774_02865 [Candidatus Aureabacteria bacterium]|nr:hypothetical protein [Candidatus Auribacterota bacterium]
MRTGLKIGIMVLIIGYLYGPSLIVHIKRSFDPSNFNDDATQHIVPFLSCYDPELLVNDHASSYFMACFPVGYKAVYSMASHFIDPRIFGKILSYVLLLLLLTGLTAAAYKLGGFIPAFWTLALTLSTDTFLSRIEGGFPRSFAFPLFAWIAAACIWGRMDRLIALILLSGTFYPVMAVPAGLALFIIFFLFPEKDLGQALFWSKKYRMTLFLLTGYFFVLILTPTFLSSNHYGPLLTPSDVQTYPEAGEGGRCRASDRPDYHFPLQEGFKAFTESTLTGSQGRPWNHHLRKWINGDGHPEKGAARKKLLLLFYWMVIAAGWIYLVLNDSSIRRLTALILAVSVGYILSRIFTPYLFWPQRVLAYPIPVFTVILLPIASSALPDLLSVSLSSLKKWVSFLRAFSTSLICGSCLLFFGGEINPSAGITVSIPKNEKLYDFIGTLPRDSLIAGWPNLMAPVPYLSMRPVWVSFETHYAYHKKYADEMRTRMRMLIEAYFATEVSPLILLRDIGRVQYLVIDTGHYITPPHYFNPFRQWIKEAFSAAEEKQFEVLRQLPFTVIFSEGNKKVLDLSRLKR